MQYSAHGGADYSPPQCVGIFQDVICEDTPNADYIEALYNEGVTAGCNADPLQYCPDSPVTRSEMAVFLLAALEGADYVPPACTGIFGDVPCPTYWAADWIEDLYNRGITAGCSANPLLYCPNSTTSRAEMSVFETATFGFPPHKPYVPSELVCPKYCVPTNTVGQPVSVLNPV